MLMPLDLLQPGQWADIAAIDGDPAYAASLGLQAVPAGGGNFSNPRRPGSVVTLDSLQVGQEAEVLMVDGPVALQQRLAEFGLYEGAELEFVAVAPLGDPIEIRLGSTRLSLRRAEAASIHVRLRGPQPPA
jgi:ferrous iron transport protein A